MPNRPTTTCTSPGCQRQTANGGRCQPCRDRRANARPTPAERGYDTRWATSTRIAYLTRHPWCQLCGHAATIPDHWPTSRRQLIAQHVPDPDADHRLRPLCASCHSSETAHNQPAGWHLANQAGY